MSRKQLIVQLSTEALTPDQLFEIEETLVQAFSQNRHAIVDGHDFGNGTMNIFIVPRGSWDPVIERVKAFLKLRKVLSQAVIAKQHKVSEKFEVVWPVGFSGNFQLM